MLEMFGLGRVVSLKDNQLAVIGAGLGGGHLPEASFGVGWCLARFGVLHQIDVEYSKWKSTWKLLPRQQR